MWKAQMPTDGHIIDSGIYTVFQDLMTILALLSTSCTLICMLICMTNLPLDSGKKPYKVYRGRTLLVFNQEITLPWCDGANHSTTVDHISGSRHPLTSVWPLLLISNTVCRFTHDPWKPANFFAGTHWKKSFKLHLKPQFPSFNTYWI